MARRPLPFLTCFLLPAALVAGCGGCYESGPPGHPGVYFVEVEPNDVPDAATLIPPELALGVQNYSWLDEEWESCYLCQPWPMSFVNGATDPIDIIHVSVDRSLLRPVGGLTSEKELNIRMNSFWWGDAVDRCVGSTGPYYGAGDAAMWCLYAGEPPPFDADGTDGDPQCDLALAMKSCTYSDTTLDCEIRNTSLIGDAAMVFPGDEIADDYYLVFKAGTTADKDMCWALEVFDGNLYCGDTRWAGAGWPCSHG
jgi:hypothetical protein